jgi:formylglycine-generating enzyme required for sulfatase activity
MRKCPKGADPLGRYTLTKDFFAGVFAVTQKQWYLVMGSNAGNYSKGTGDTYPVYFVSYDMIRGSSSGSGWPSSSAVDADSFIGKLRTKTGLPELDLPTDAQWEYACRAGSTATYNLGDSTEALGLAGWYLSNSGSSTHAVGGKLPNNWGLYDMHGNVGEWCLDWSASSALSGTDPKGSVSGSYRCFRGGSWGSVASYCTSSYRNSGSPSVTSYSLGFRLFRTWP